MRRRVRAAILAAAVLGAGSSSVTMAAPAQAVQYRYWSYWHVDAGSPGWTYSNMGASSTRPRDGSVEGWRFAVGILKPDASADNAFSRICGATSAVSGMSRVAVVVDVGVVADAPDGDRPPSPRVRGECVVVSTASTGRQVLGGAGFTVRDQTGQAGFICGISGYPRTACPEPAAIDPAPSPSPTATTPRAASPSPARQPAAASSPSAARSSTATPTGSLAQVGSAPTTTAVTAAPALAPVGSVPRSQSTTAPAPVGAATTPPDRSPLVLGAPAEPSAGHGSPIAALAAGSAVAALAALAARARRRRGGS